MSKRQVIEDDTPEGVDVWSSAPVREIARTRFREGSGWLLSMLLGEIRLLLLATERLLRDGATAVGEGSVSFCGGVS